MKESAERVIERETNDAFVSVFPSSLSFMLSSLETPYQGVQLVHFDESEAYYCLMIAHSIRSKKRCSLLLYHCQDNVGVINFLEGLSHHDRSSLCRVCRACQDLLHFRGDTGVRYGWAVHRRLLFPQIINRSVNSLKTPLGFCPAYIEL